MYVILAGAHRFLVGVRVAQEATKQSWPGKHCLLNQEISYMYEADDSRKIITHTSIVSR